MDQWKRWKDELPTPDMYGELTRWCNLVKDDVSGLEGMEGCYLLNLYEQKVLPVLREWVEKCSDASFVEATNNTINIVESTVVAFTPVEG